MDIPADDESGRIGGHLRRVSCHLFPVAMGNKSTEEARSAPSAQTTAIAAKQTQDHRERIRQIAILLGVWLVVYVPGLFRPALLDDADSVHAEAGKEMLLRYDWVTLHVDDIRYLEKAPLLYWLTAASYKLFGVREWSTQLVLRIGVLALTAAA